jgi:hypothetical protein
VIHDGQHLDRAVLPMIGWTVWPMISGHSRAIIDTIKISLRSVNNTEGAAIPDTIKADQLRCATRQRICMAKKSVAEGSKDAATGIALRCPGPASIPFYHGLPTGAEGDDESGTTWQREPANRPAGSWGPHHLSHMKCGGHPIGITGCVNNREWALVRCRISSECGLYSIRDTLTLLNVIIVSRDKKVCVNRVDDLAENKRWKEHIALIAEDLGIAA